MWVPCGICCQLELHWCEVRGAWGTLEDRTRGMEQWRVGGTAKGCGGARAQTVCRAFMQRCSSLRCLSCRLCAICRHPVWGNNAHPDRHPGRRTFPTMEGCVSMLHLSETPGQYSCKIPQISDIFAWLLLPGESAGFSVKNDLPPT